MLLLAATPTWYGHSPINAKDIPFAAGYVWTLLAILVMAAGLPRIRLGPAIWFGFALALDKPGGFVGQDAVLARKSANDEAGGMAQRIVQVRVLDPEPLLFHAEVLRRNGHAVGYLRSASYGWTVGGAVGLAMVSGGSEPVTLQWLEAGSWDVDIAGRRHPVEVSVRPWYDPTSARVKV